MTLEKLERTRMERDRAGILFSNILRQVRGRVHKTESLGTLDNTMMVYNNSHHYGASGMTSGMANKSFFKTSTDQISYKQILGFEIRREDEEELLL